MDESQLDSMKSINENVPESVAQRMFKLESTRRKYERFVEIKAVIKNQTRNSSAFKDIEIVKYECRLCNKINSTQIGGTGNIRKHLMIHKVDMDDLDATAFDSDSLETFKKQKAAQTDLDHDEDDLNLSHSTDNIDVSRRMFRNESTRLRYEKFVKIRDIRTSIKKQSKTSNKEGETESQEMTEIVKYECLLCYKVLSTQVSGTGNIRKHLKTHNIDLSENTTEAQNSNRFAFIPMNEIEEYESAEKSEDEPINWSAEHEDEEVSRRMFKTDSTRIKYERFVKIREIYPTIKKKQKTASDRGEIAIRELSENVKYECRLCNKILSTQVGGTGNIRKHLKTHNIDLDEHSSAQIQSYENDTQAIESTQCRLCLTSRSDTKYISIIETSGVEALRIFLISGVKVIENRGNPAMMCQKCSEELEVADQIRKKCLQAEKFFQRLVLEDTPALYHHENIKIEPRENQFEIIKEEPMFNETHKSYGELVFCDQIEENCDNVKTTLIRSTQLLSKVKHQITLKKRKPEAYLCSFCSKSFNFKHNLKSHELKKHFDGESKYECDICGKRAPVLKMLKEHFRTVHPPLDRRLICSTCGREFRNKSAFRNHEQLHSPETFPCNDCDRIFHTQKTCTKHRRIVHEKAEQRQCDVEGCNVILSCSYTFNKHKECMHTELPRKFKCTMCPWKFKTSQALVKHKRVHTGEKRYKCTNEGCNRAFCDRKGIVNHQKNCQFIIQSI